MTGRAAGATLTLLLLLLSCIVVEHDVGPDDFDCPFATRPTCCNTCNGTHLVEPRCAPAGWECPPPSVSSSQCSGQGLACLGAVDGGGDGGTCRDGGSSQVGYRFEGCAPASAACPNDGTLGCALGIIQDRFDGCRFSTDCVEAELDGRCSRYGACPPFTVNADQRAAFLSQAQAEVDRYCGCATCNASGGACPFNRDAGAPRCVYGRCLWLDRDVSLVCANPSSGACYGACAEDEACFTQMACPGGSDAGGCAIPDAGAVSLPGDNLCHRRCALDGGCPAGEACFLAAFYGCGDQALPQVTPICCRADAGCL